MSGISEQAKEIRQNIATISSEAMEKISSGEVDIYQACEFMYIMQEMKRDVAFIIEELEKMVAEGMPEDIFFLPSGQQVERRTGSDRKSWNHKGLAEMVAERVYESSVDMETGEVMMSPKEMMTKMLDYAAPSYWRVKELDKIGISADSYCEKTEGKTSIVISRLND